MQASQGGNDQQDEAPSKKEPAKKAAATKGGSHVPKVPFLTVAEFDNVPKYMRGRLTYDAVNAAIEEYNGAVEDKYAFLRRGFQAMGSIKDKKRFKELRAQETRECKGAHFVVADDLRECGSLKSEAARRAVFTILRHCGRVREIRKPGMPLKYAVAV